MFTFLLSKNRPAPRLATGAGMLACGCTIVAGERLVQSVPSLHDEALLCGFIRARGGVRFGLLSIHPIERPAAGVVDLEQLLGGEAAEHAPDLRVDVGADLRREHVRRAGHHVALLAEDRDRLRVDEGLECVESERTHQPDLVRLDLVAGDHLGVRASAAAVVVLVEGLAQAADEAALLLQGQQHLRGELLVAGQLGIEALADRFGEVHHDLRLVAAIGQAALGQEQGEIFVDEAVEDGGEWPERGRQLPSLALHAQDELVEAVLFSHFLADHFRLTFSKFFRTNGCVICFSAHMKRVTLRVRIRMLTEETNYGFFNDSSRIIGQREPLAGDLPDDTADLQLSEHGKDRGMFKLCFCHDGIKRLGQTSKVVDEL